ncbi:disease resistance protein RPV1 isoform X1 [Lactuca sativa]|uniref:disease resistance protein RPV1 isoform X1 n=1 Tax=Lactuca sativa TaxID=4236 RepID=UPI000CD9C1CF|nr:disease resistance protein RPV1 isoform X1 [Lactuca sativa]XP_042758392.1 disease resistance protein RPV1 isoform X1 [Lactuca sativa]XP_042758396.1 disease resistance protein RPV1 isoform X1 [Lactuca sativa]XP_042758398.1 disease resistance protein RPV1 isoform X1 [Lactuca sativa]XP_042758403.1 disease resistance protein RPV1 isoform X1 [Lactuca sativa]XP_052619903.1 disease resistance protein RPV1 isoform X1 [Lactuca sativa]
MVLLFELPEGSSSSSSTHGHNSSTQDHRYDVFLSFRGVDTRLSFTNYLYEALMDANLNTFLDDEEIETGEDLKPELESAIKASRASIIVLSKNYASSTWCLDELVLILEQCMTSNHIVIPIFYHVEPTHVRKQQSSFGDAMAKHKLKMDEETEENKRNQWGQKIERWNKALIEVANLKGNDINGRFETEFIEEIVKDIYRRLHVPLKSAQPLFIGMDYSINFITSWLKDGSSHTVDILTISGLGGIGKTSLAKHVYGLYCHEFNKSSYIEDITRRCDGKYNGLLDIQKQLCGDISKTSSIQVYDVSKYTSMIENVVARKRLFLVLDDINSIDQLDALLGSKGFHPGSKVIITTKDKCLTESCALFKTNIKPKHVEHFLEGLDETESRQLLCSHAFMCNHPKEGYEEVSAKLLEYCQGHPLALEVLGKVLHNRGVAYWEGCMKGLKKETNDRINNVLRMSFNSLPSKNDKDLFKHIACFFVGIDKDLSETILEACDINTRSGITNLIDKCLLSIGRNNELKMHQLVQEMGRFEVHQESPDKPWKRSRLWCHKESFRVLKQKKGKGNLLGLSLDMYMLEKEKLRGSFELKTDALSNMDNLMILQLNYVHMHGSYKNFPEEIRWLCMHGFYSKSIPLNLPIENLVALDMSYSNIESFVGCYSNPQRLEKRQRLDGSCFKEKRLFASLKILNLSFCEQLHSVGDFDQLSALERLILRNCIGLVDVCESIGQCVELILIDLSYCKKLEKLPRNIGMLKKVKTMLLDGCDLGESGIKNLDMDSLEMCTVTNIGINRAFMGCIPRDLKSFAMSLPRSLVKLSLKKNKLSNESFPMDFSCLSMLKELDLDGNPFNSMPSCVRTLPRLEILWMNKCKNLKSVEYPPSTLKKLFLNAIDHYHTNKVVFVPEMSPLQLSMDWLEWKYSSLELNDFEVEGMIKIQEMMSVDEKVLRSLGWTNLDFLNERHVGTNPSESEIQMMYYEFGIFSTMYEAEEMPSWFRHRSVGPVISFTIPSSSPNNILTGLNICSLHTLNLIDVELYLSDDDLLPWMPIMTITNITKNRTWIYERYLDRFNEILDFWVILSHWMFRKNEMEAGDHITITVTPQLPEPLTEAYNELVKECGVSLVYEDGEKKDEEEDVLGYYKSWNHIIGGDLSPFQTTTGEYLLNRSQFFPYDVTVSSYHCKFVPDGLDYQDQKEEYWFRALSPRKPDILGRACEDKGESSGSRP